ncbi:hypothetical protein K493DRAFT_388745 [Basidiobolus meristosporus CBS 931.73]|uniref:CUE domain-containing protein n=1 Tax=Basidiobolus meristosporus CBS 931.73 TaxID=1314790 RepID=A0A1Y1X9D8_9FUNG|nr:hypothetical protein K493DRAFT_388745 [Basidiobolus meristosporus CBS 931.73]|eukprot:ORX82357.1 hypothetical protein K493DRAFT_388745 [Basidiobolus meristosporus CBS 931.73]
MNADLEQMFFVPYVPPVGEKSSPQSENWLHALQLWNNSLRRLLQVTDQKFQEFLAVDESFPIFAQTYLRYRSREIDSSSDPHTSEAEAELSKRVLMVFFRISNGSDWAYMELLHRRNILVVPILLDLALAYADSNSKVTQSIFGKILTAVPVLKESFKESIDFLGKYISKISNIYRNRTATTYDLETWRKHLIALTDIVRTLDNACKSSEFIGSLLNENKEFITLLFNFYGEAVLAMQTQLAEADPIESKPLRTLLVRLKYSIMCLLYSILDSCFFRQFRDASGNQDALELAMENCCQTFMFIMDLTNATKEAVPFINAPLLVDTEIELDAEQNVNIYVQRSSLISQIQDLFPHLGDGFLEACLIEFNDDVERVIMLLLEDSLPSSLSQLDRSMKRSPLEPVDAQIAIPEPTAPSADLISQRQNIFNNDEFDVFTRRDVDLSKVSFGKKDRGNADQMLNDKDYVQSNKQSLLETLFNEDDDEYDDTYDGINEVGGSLDAHLLDDLDNQAEGQATTKSEDLGTIHEGLLVQEMASDPSVFERNAKARKSAQRQKLRNITGMSDEQIEGWYVMLMRNAKKGKLIEKYELQGNQNRDATAQTPRSDEPSSRAAHPPKNPKARNGKVEDPSKQQSTNMSDRDKARKEKSKGKRANHNRKGQHMKKMALNNAV